MRVAAGTGMGIEMRPMAHHMGEHDEEVGDPESAEAAEQEKGQSEGQPKKRCWGLIHNPLQYGAACGVCTALAAGVIGAIIIIAALQFSKLNSQQQTAAILFGGGVIIFSTLSCAIASILFCCMPESYKKQNEELKEQTIKFGAENKYAAARIADLNKTEEKYTRLVETQGNVLDKLDKTFDKGTAALETQRNLIQQELDATKNQLANVVKELQAKTQEIKALSEQIANSNAMLKNNLERFNVGVGHLKEHEKERQKEIEKQSAENDEFKQHNLQFQQIGKGVNDQIAMMSQLIDAYASKEEELKQLIKQITELKQQYLAISGNLQKTVEEKERIETLGERKLEQLTEIVAQLREALLGIQNSDQEQIEKSELQPLLDLLDRLGKAHPKSSQASDDK